jgi:putative GTP pyrophosphokinase
MAGMTAPASEADQQQLKFIRAYNARRPQFAHLLRQVTGLFEEYRRTKENDPKLRVHSIRGRIKSLDSLFAKIKRSDIPLVFDGARPFEGITDIVGTRIVCNTLEGKAAACRWLEVVAAGPNSLFKIREAKTIEYETGYRSQHYLVTLVASAWPTLRINTSDDDEDVVVEVQIRTILEEAWGEIEHDLQYKTARAPAHRDEAVLRPGFVALSHRLHDADILVQRLTRRIVDEPLPSPRGGAVAKEQRSLELDVSKIGISEPAARQALEVALHEAETLRLAGDHEAASKIHSGLVTDPRFSAPRAIKILKSEEALDQLIHADTLMRERRDLDQAEALLRSALDIYQGAMTLDPDGNNVIIKWRLSQVCLLSGDVVRSRFYLNEALDEIEKKGRPDYVRVPFYKAALKTRLGALDLREYEERRYQEPRPNESTQAALLQRAGNFLQQAVGDQRDARPAEGRPPKEWMLDTLTAYNNLAWYQFRREEFEAAKVSIDAAKEHVDPAIWEQHVHFLGTILSVELALLPVEPDLGWLTFLDSLRIRILNILSLPDTFVFKPNVISMLKSIKVFEERWHEHIRGQLPDDHAVAPLVKDDETKA